MTEQTESKPDITLPYETLRVLYDLAINSMDFGSGFWDVEDHEAVQRIAVVLGVEYPRCDTAVWHPDHLNLPYSQRDAVPRTVVCDKLKGHAEGHVPWSPAEPDQAAPGPRGGEYPYKIYDTNGKIVAWSTNPEDDGRVVQAIDYKEQRRKYQALKRAGRVS